MPKSMRKPPQCEMKKPLAREGIDITIEETYTADSDCDPRNIEEYTILMTLPRCFNLANVLLIHD